MTAAAAKHDECNNNNPAAAIVAKYVAKTVVHKKSSLIVEGSTLPHYHCMSDPKKCVEKYQISLVFIFTV